MKKHQHPKTLHECEVKIYPRAARHWCSNFAWRQLKKRIVLYADSYAIFVMSASRKLHTKLIRREFKSKNVRFATPEELSQLTNGLVPGSVPPFGRPIVDLDLFVDSSIVENEKIAFNCGSLTDSIVMDRADYMNVAAPNKVFAFSK